MKQIILAPTITVTVQDNGEIVVDTEFGGSIVEVHEDGEFRDATDEEIDLVDEVIIPFVTKTTNL
jgi:hypothetical protein